MTETINAQMIHTCSKCGVKTQEQQAIANEYKCSQCDYELAHLDMAANGAIRGVFGWLKETGAEIGGRYQVETVLGKGGFGATYLVKDQRVQGKRWALKEIPEILFDEYEVSLLSQLDHPSIPIIVDRFTDSDMVYLVLKFGGTKTLATECKRGKTVAYHVLKPWIIQLADVLKYLHSRTPPIIHRDLKPENILIDNEDRVMLIDFGIAKESIAETATRTLGRAASHGFSPPEQVMGTGTDVRSDIYSFAATIYYALTGKTPVAAHERVAGAVLQTPRELVPDLPVEVDVMLTKALNLNINERPQTISEFLVAFTGISTVADDNKTVQISDIQFGPVLNDKKSRSTPLTNQPELAAQQNKKSRLNFIILGIVLISVFGAASAYWFINNETDDPIIKEPIEAAVPAEVTTPIAVVPQITTPTQEIELAPVLQQKQNTLSAYDILKQRRENQTSVEVNIVDQKPKPSSSVSAKLKERTAYKSKSPVTTYKSPRKVTKKKKAPNWGIQPKGTF